MSWRRFSAWVFVLLFVAIGVLAFAGDRLLFAIYAVITVPLLVAHATYICPRCTNLACALNPRSAEYFLRRTAASAPALLPYSDQRVGLVSALPLSVAGVAGFLGVWRFSPWAALALLAVSVPTHAVYTRVTCRYCTNRCFGNRNPHYRRWRQEREESAIR